jgi:hypothetical protein
MSGEGFGCCCSFTVFGVVLINCKRDERIKIVIVARNFTVLRLLLHGEFLKENILRVLRIFSMNILFTVEACKSRDSEELNE